MGLFDKFKKPKEPQGPRRVKGAAMLFCPETDPKKALDRIGELFQIETVGDRNHITLCQDDMEIILLSASPDEEGENGQYAKEQLQGVAGYVYQNQTEQLEIKRNLFYHLRQCKSLIQIVYSFDSASPAETAEKEKQVKAPLFDITEQLQGVITFGDGMSLQNSRGQVILNKEGKSELDWYLPAERPVPEDWAKDAPAESVKRRDKSMTLLREKRIYVTPWLPLLHERAEEPGRTVEEVCRRAAALLIVSLYSECRVGDHLSYEKAREFVDPIIESYGAEESFFSPEEWAYLNDPNSDEKTQIQYAWQYENLWVMEWALGLTDDLFWPTRICDVPQSVRMMREYPSMAELAAAARPRPRKELLDQADLIYRIHWACVDARVMNMPAPQELEEGVVMERHRALFWLAGCDGMRGWDDVDLST